MGKAADPDKVKEAERQLREQKSVAEVCREVGLSRPTVLKIAEGAGLAPSDGRRKPDRALEMATVLKQSGQFSDAEICRVLGFSLSRVSKIKI